MRYGFAIDQRSCIGCHACTVACKTEYQIPVGRFRTWVKYIDQGEWPIGYHHMGRWRLHEGEGSRWVSGQVDLTHPDGPDSWLLRYRSHVQPFTSSYPDSERIYWSDPVHQNLAFAVQPDPLSGMNCWLQQVTLEPAHADDRYGDVFVDRRRSRAVYREWLAMTRATTGPRGQRRPEFLMRPVKPKRKAYRAT